LQYAVLTLWVLLNIESQILMRSPKGNNPANYEKKA